MSDPRYQSWGRLDFGPQTGVRLSDRLDPLPTIAAGTTALPFGNGRSYGDSCLNSGGVLLDCGRLDRFLSLDRDSGVLRCEAGVLLADILEAVVPRGWFLPVSPGTQWASVGGAIANDVHGKNHHRAGSFGCHVRAFELLRSTGERLVCSPTDHAELFAATIGGLGLTGVITWAELQLKAVGNGFIDEEVIRFHGLDDFFTLSTSSDAAFEYTVAWIDCLARGRALGRGLFTRGNHAATGAATPPKPARARPAVPVAPPFSLINRLSLRVFNTLYFRRQRRDRVARRVHYQPFFYPLDAIANWNRMYGPKGFFQYQCVLPPAAGEAGVREMLDAIAASRSGSFLAVLKMFGEIASPGLLSFARPGVTLALDFPNTGADVRALLDRLDGITGAHGGAVYPAKDARMSAEMFRQGFPQWRTFANFIDPAFSSSFWRRVNPPS